MSINSMQVYMQTLLNGLAMPGGAPNLVCYITPPNPNVQAEFPTAYVWPSSGSESRNPQRGGTVPRASYLGGPSGTKPTEHVFHIYLVWDQANDDPLADTWFPGMVDAILSVLRVSEDPVVVTDPFTNVQSQLVDVGENMTYQITVNALEDQRMFRYDALITCSLLEIMRS